MNTLTKTILRSDELSGPSCISNIESTLNNMEGIEEATVHFSTGRIEVARDVDMVSEQDLVEAVRQSGYEAYISVF